MGRGIVIDVLVSALTALRKTKEFHETNLPSGGVDGGNESLEGKSVLLCFLSDFHQRENKISHPSN